MTTTAYRVLALLSFAVLTVAGAVKATSFGSPYIAVVTLVVGGLFVGGVIHVIEPSGPPDSNRRH